MQLPRDHITNDVRDAIVIPIKQFDLAKERLRSAGAENVTALAERLALGVLHGSRPRHVIVLSESKRVTDFALAHGAEVVESNASGLNEAVQLAYDQFGQRFDRLIIAHGDLRSPQGLGNFEPARGVTIVTDHHLRGTNVLVVPTRVNFRFAYGPDSSARHQREAQRLHVDCSVITDSAWRFDVDEPEDAFGLTESIWGGPKTPPNSTP